MTAPTSGQLPDTAFVPCHGVVDSSQGQEGASDSQFLSDIRWFQFGALRAGAGGCDWLCVWTVLQCGLCSLYCSFGLDYVATVHLYDCSLWPGLCGNSMCAMLSSMIHLWATVRGISSL
jgi:hypothetical protein